MTESTTELWMDLSVRPAKREVAELQKALAAQAEVDEQPAESFNFDATSLLLILSATADAVVVADTLVKWLKSLSTRNEAAIRLADGRTLKMTADSDPELFVKQLRAALKKL